MHSTVICDIVSCEEELDHCVEAQMHVYIVLKLYVVEEETIGQCGVWDAC